MKPSLWLIEDDPLWSELIQQRYKDKFDLQYFSSVDSAIEAFHSAPKKPRYILLDYHIGGKTGIAFLKAIRKHENPEKPPYVIMLSGQEDVQTAVDTFTYGAYDYVVKGEQVWERLKITFRNIARQEELEREIIELRIRFRRWQLLVGGILLLITIVFFSIYLRLCPDERLLKWDPLDMQHTPRCAPASS
ncbi:MAG: response regulator [Bacteroidia bacterium]|nr:response regulator [Bacteroidia bacterium]MDW8236537.1 response regulator [Bacteroidia bacterium]